ncbi:MAG: hypothetical protein NDF54_09385 [archaeon GB-1867-035]|nr:hypothetical protein [Candidatus Culexmicrobium profundum]
MSMKSFIAFKFLLALMLLNSISCVQATSKISYSYNDVEVMIDGTKVWFYEHIQIQVLENGSLIVWIESLVSNPFFDISDVSKGLFCSSLSIKKNEQPEVTVHYDLNKISREEADIYANELCQKWLSVFGGKGELVDVEEVSITSPLTGKTYRSIFYVYKVEDLSIDRIIHLFMEYKPKKGFLDLLNKDNIKSFNKLIFHIFRDETGNIRYELKYQGYFPSYFKFKAGETYVLDVFKLFNFTGPLRVNDNSFGSTIWIFLMKRSNFDIALLEARVPEKLTIHKGRYRISFENDPPSPFLPGEQIDELFIKFKIVETGFKLPSFSSQMLGYIIIGIALPFSIFIIYYHFKKKNKFNVNKLRCTRLFLYFAHNVSTES